MASKWKCTNCGNRVYESNPPIVCPISCCGNHGSYVIDNTPGSALAAKWKCTNCGNYSSDPTAPVTCEISCCNATNSYVPVD